MSIRIINAMFGRGLGGIEQAVIDYTRALTLQKHDVCTLIHSNAAIRSSLEQMNVAYKTVHNMGAWDYFAVRTLKNIIKEFQPDAILTHGNRALCLLTRAADKVPIIGVCHNYQLQYIHRAQASFTVTESIRHAVCARGISSTHTAVIPNMFDSAGMIPLLALKSRSPLFIGAMGRWVAKKGFDRFLHACALLKEQGQEFKVILAGDGEEKEYIQKLINQLSLHDIMTTPGWIHDKTSFYNDIDVFCLPSPHEPFGIVILEAWYYGVPIVTFPSEGPSAIITDKHTGIITRSTQPADLASSLAQALTNADLRLQLAKEGQKTLQTNYSFHAVGEKLSYELNRILSLIKSEKNNS